MRVLMLLGVAIVMLAGCGHSQIDYTPSANRGMTPERAMSIIERGFYEDYGDQRPQAVQFTEEAIILSDGMVTTGSHIGSVVPVYGSAIVSGASVSKTVAAGQRIYLKTLLPSMVMKKNLRSNRYAVIIRQSPGFTARRVYFRSQSQAQSFADALAYMKTIAQ